MRELSFVDISERLKYLELPEFDVVVGIADSGVVPASLVADKLGCELAMVKFKYRNDRNVPIYREPVLMKGIDLPSWAKKILLVDDVSVSGKTIRSARDLFGEYSIKTLVFKGEADFVLFPELDKCVEWPWKLKESSD